MLHVKIANVIPDVALKKSYNWKSANSKPLSKPTNNSTIWLAYIPCVPRVSELS